MPERTVLFSLSLMVKNTDITGERDPRTGPDMIMVRHGESEANVAGIWQGHIESPLSPLGMEQAMSVGRALAERFGPVAAIYSSPLGRARQTARAIARQTGFSGELQLVDGLIERHGGRLQGHRWVDYAAEHPELAERFITAPESERWDIFGAEGTDSVTDRARRAVKRISERHSAGEVVVLTTHGGLLKAFIAETFGPEVFGKEVRVPNTSITGVRYVGGEPQLVELANTAHLKNITVQPSD